MNSAIDQWNYGYKMKILKFNQGKPVVAEWLIRTFKNETSKYMTAILKNLFINRFAELVKEYSNTIHRATDMKPVDVKYGVFYQFWCWI